MARLVPGHWSLNSRTVSVIKGPLFEPKQGY